MKLFEAQRYVCLQGNVRYKREKERESETFSLSNQNKIANLLE